MTKSRFAITIFLLLPLLLVGAVYSMFKNHSYFSQTVESRLNESFREYVRKAQHESRLQIAEIQRNETFEVDSRSVSGPANFKYFVALNKAWKIHTEDKKIIALAPAIEFSATSPLSSVTPQALDQRAVENSASVREATRKEISAFLTTWLRSEFPKESEFDIKVDFQN
jgi:hypothetical protein